VSWEIQYSDRLFKLARTTGSVFKSYNLSEYKQFEEPGMQDLIHSFIESTIQQGESHKQFAESIKNSSVGILSQCLTDCRNHKDSWISSIDSFYKSQTTTNKKVDKLKKKLSDKKVKFIIFIINFYLSDFLKTHSESS